MNSIAEIHNQLETIEKRLASNDPMIGYLAQSYLVVIQARSMLVVATWLETIAGELEQIGSTLEGMSINGNSNETAPRPSGE